MPLIPLTEPAAAMAELVRRRAPLPAAGASQTYPDVPPPVPGTVPLEEVLAGRRSVRTFTTEPLRLEELRAVLDRAAAAQQDQWPPGRYGDPGLRLLLAVRRADGLDRGLYDRSTQGTLHALGRPDWLDEPAHDYADAPVLALICGSALRVAPHAIGALLLRAGSLGYAIWLSARTYGLECSVFGAGHAPTRRAASRIRPGDRHLFTVALGHPAPAVG